MAARGADYNSQTATRLVAFAHTEPINISISRRAPQAVWAVHAGSCRRLAGAGEENSACAVRATARGRKRKRKGRGRPGSVLTCPSRAAAAELRAPVPGRHGEWVLGCLIGAELCAGVGVGGRVGSRADEVPCWRGAALPEPAGAPDCALSLRPGRVGREGSFLSSGGSFCLSFSWMK